MNLRHLASTTLVVALAGLSVTVVDAGVAHAATTASAADIRISEAAPNGGKGSGTGSYAADFIELSNSSAQDEDVSGWVLKDDKDSDSYVLPSGSVVPAGGYLQIAEGSGGFSFGLGSPADAARLYESDGSTLVDEIYWNAVTSSPNDSWTRCASSTGAWDVMDEPSTPGAANSCPDPTAVTADLQSHIHVNEAMASETSTTPPNNADWIEVDNTGPATVDLSGWWLSDDKSTDKDVLPAGSFLDPDSLYGGGPDADPTADLHTYDYWNVGTGSWPAGSTDFGLGSGGDNAALVFPNGTDDDRLVFGGDDGTKPAGNSSTVAAPEAGGTVGRNPDGGSTWAQTYAPTPGAPNQFGNPADTTVKLNEVDTADNTVELVNTGTSAASVGGWTITDAAAATYTVPAGTTIAAGAYDAIPVSSAFTFSASGDSVTVYDGTNQVDTTSWTGAQSTSWGRCPDSTGSFTATAAATDGAKNDCAAPAATPGIRISEVETNGDPLGDWIELTNTSSAAIDIGGWYLADDGGTSTAMSTFPTDSGHYWQIPAGTSVPAGGYLTVYSSYSNDATYPDNTLAGAGFGFGLGGPDEARIFDASKTLVDGVAWPTHESGPTYARCTNATQNVVFTDSADSAPFINSTSSTPGAANDCYPPVRINEFDANGNNDGTAAEGGKGHDWVELTNIGSAPVDLDGWILTDDSNADGDVITATTPTLGGTLDTSKNDGSAFLAPGSYVAFRVDSTTDFPTPPAGKSGFGLGASGDEVRLYEPGAWTSGTTYDASDLVDSVAWGSDASASPVPNGVTTTLPGFTSWPATATTWGRCSDGKSEITANGTGAWAQTASPTPAASNDCTGLVSETPWPDSHYGQADTPADNTDLGQNMSGLFYVAGKTPADDYMWGIQNGSSGLSGANAGDPGSLYKLVQDPATGLWGPATGWESGVPVRYLNDATGEIDSEGVTAVHGDVFVTSERDNTNSDVSKIAVVEVDPSKVVAKGGTLDGATVNDTDGDLGATHEWDLGSDLGPGGAAGTGLDASNPGDANLGLEGVTFVPDSALTSEGFVDANTGTAYKPSDYPDHIDGGLFFVAMEKNGDIYAYAFNSDNTFTRVATIKSGFPTIMDLEWDPSIDALWATCDNTCQGASSVLKIDQTAGSPTQGTFQLTQVNERPATAGNFNNEGFTVQPASECADGSRSAYWSDDTDDNNVWLRTAHLDCTTPISGQTGATVSTALTVTGTSTPATPDAEGYYLTPVTATFTCTDGDAVLNQACPAPVDITSSQAAQTVATLTDTLGNTYDASIPAVNIDTPPSASSITVQGPTGLTNDSTPSFTFTSSDSAVTGYQCALAPASSTDQPSYADCSSGYTASTLADGAYTLSVEAVDAHGGASAPVTASFTVDATKPALRIGGPKAGVTYAGTGPTPRCVASDAGSGLASCRVSVRRTTKTVHVTATAVDKAGNVATATMSYRTLPISVLGKAPHGTYRARSYPAIVLTTTRTAPRYLAPVPGWRPKGRGVAFKSAGVVNGVHVWKLTLRKPRLATKRVYTGAIKVGSKLTKLHYQR